MNNMNPRDYQNALQRVGIIETCDFYIIVFISHFNSSIYNWT